MPDILIVDLQPRDILEMERLRPGYLNTPGVQFIPNIAMEAAGIRYREMNRRSLACHHRKKLKKLNHL